MVDAANDSSPPDLLKIRDDVHALRSKIQDLETKLTASQSLVQNVTAERDSVRNMITKKEQEMQGEDQATMDEMKKLLDEVTARFNNNNANGPQLSGTDLLRQFAETMERSAENMAKRAEVSSHKILPPKFLFAHLFLSSKFPNGKLIYGFPGLAMGPSLSPSPLYTMSNTWVCPKHPFLHPINTARTRG